MSGSGKMLKVHQAVARAFVDHGVKVMFGLMGDANMFMVDSYVRECGGRFIPAVHEAGAAGMALGYALQTGGIGVCSVTHGPAMTNTITQLVQGVKASVPLLVVAGDTDTLDREHTQNVCQRDFAVMAGAGFVQMRSPKTAVEDVLGAMRQALVERRPVVLNIPAEFDWVETSYEPRQSRLPERRASVLESEDIDDAVGIIAAAKRPLILAGRGATSPEAKAALIRLARRIEAPLATTLKAKDLFHGEPENIGIFGTVSTDAAVEVIVESDCIIAFGAGLNRYTTSLGTFLKGKRVVQVNQEAGDIGRNAAIPDAGVVGDAASVADIFHHWMEEAEIPSSGFCTAEMITRLAESSTRAVAEGADLDNGDGTVDYQGILRWLDANLPADRILVTDGGRFMKGVWTSIHASGFGSFITTVDFGSIGLGLPHALGAAQAANGRPVVLVTGDGGFMHGGLTEFHTAVSQKNDLIVIVLNDHAYGAEHIKFVARDMDPSMIYFEWPDFGAVAKCLGGDGCTISSLTHLDKAREMINARSGPIIIDVKLDPDKISGN